jgi:hypothetical protein
MLLMGLPADSLRLVLLRAEDVDNALDEEKSS